MWDDLRRKGLRRVVTSMWTGRIDNVAHRKKGPNSTFNTSVDMCLTLKQFRTDACDTIEYVNITNADISVFFKRRRPSSEEGDEASLVIMIVRIDRRGFLKVDKILSQSVCFGRSEYGRQSITTPYLTAERRCAYIVRLRRQRRHAAIQLSPLRRPHNRREPQRRSDGARAPTGRLRGVYRPRRGALMVFVLSYMRAHVAVVRMLAGMSQILKESHPSATMMCINGDDDGGVIGRNGSWLKAFGPDRGRIDESVLTRAGSKPPAPCLGEHVDAVALESGYSADRVGRRRLPTSSAGLSGHALGRASPTNGSIEIVGAARLTGDSELG
ncbi:hypothetical protein EVAR_97207_1 [Eumeta japonica]|uniref:Uncharacterized protein n=1 Tax=Eumeta variegata TaxID=151549 RepID=A0A4C1WJB6_EUMVA|nr:hypothetical protein EVAR_97207_1 [Eumeta japonica]